MATRLRESLFELGVRPLRIGDRFEDGGVDCKWLVVALLKDTSAVCWRFFEDEWVDGMGIKKYDGTTLREIKP